VIQNKEKLEFEAARGEQYKRIMEVYIEPFIASKQEQLFQSFIDSSTENPELLQLIKLQSNALASLSDEFKSHITTGELASKQLNEDNIDG